MTERLHFGNDCVAEFSTQKAYTVTPSKRDLAPRIIQLGGTPPISPQIWYEMTNCGYEAPEDPYVEVLLEQNIKGEQCAIDVYQDLIGLTKDTDPVTYDIVLQILTDELEHEEDLQALVEDIELMRKRR